MKGAAPARFAYRSVARPVLGVNAAKAPEGLDLWTAGENGIPHMRAVAQFPD